jgi:hypothetical protein
MRLITVLDAVKFEDGRRIEAHYHILTEMTLVEFIGHYGKGLRTRAADHAAQGKQRSFAIVNDSEVHNLSQQDVAAMQSGHFTGYVLLADGTQVEFERWEPRGRLTR